MLQREHSAILSTCIKLTSIFKTFVLSILSGRLRQVLLYMYTVDFSKKLFYHESNICNIFLVFYLEKTEQLTLDCCRTTPMLLEWSESAVKLELEIL